MSITCYGGVNEIGGHKIVLRDGDRCLSFLDPEVPIYCTAMTAFVSKAMQDTGQADFETEVCYANLRKPVAGLLKSAGVGKQRPFVFVDGMPAGEPASEFWGAIPAKSKAFEPTATPSLRPNVASLPVRHFPVDHSIFGACAYAVLTSQGWIAYTGDLRLHGAGGHETLDEADARATSSGSDL